MQKYQKRIEFIIGCIVKYPNEVKVQLTQDDEGIHVELWVAKSDMPFIIGREGAHARTLREFVNLIGNNQDNRMSLTIKEPL